MANAKTNIYRTNDGDGKQNKEDLVDIIYDLSDTSTVLFGKLQEGESAKALLHEFNTDEVARQTTSLAVTQGADYDNTLAGSPSRKNNYVTEFALKYEITYLQNDTNITGFSDEYARESVRNMKVFSLAVEHDLFNSTLHSGNASQPSRLRGLLAGITTNATNMSGESLTESRYLDLQQSVYDQNVAIDGSWTVVPMTGKRQISGFTASSTKYQDGSIDKISRLVNIYESDLGVTEIKPSREVGSTNFVVMQPDAYALSYMRRPEEESKPSSGNYTAYAIYASATLEDRQEKAAVKATNILYVNA